MAGIDLSDLGATPVTPSSDNKMDFSDLGATPVVASGPSLSEAVGRGAAQGATLGTQPTLSPLLERAYAKLFGDKATNDLYDNLSNDDLKKSYVQQNQAALAAHPAGYIGGQIAGSLPSAIATGGLVGEGAEALSGLGAAKDAAQVAQAGGTAADAASAASALSKAKAAYALSQGFGQAAGQGALGAAQGYNANPLASTDQKIQNAEKAGLTTAALAGPIAGVAPYLPTIARVAGTTALGTGIGSVFGHPGVGAAVGAGAGYIPVIGEDLLGDTGFLGYGAKGVKLGTDADAARISNQQGALKDATANTLGDIENTANTTKTGLANDLSKSIGDLDSKISAPAIQHLSDTHQGALENYVSALNATPQQASQIIQNGQEDAITSLETLLNAGEQEGKTVTVGNAVQVLNNSLKKSISYSGTVKGDADRSTVQNAIDDVNSYLTKQGVPINIKSTTILNSEGKPFLSNLQVSGKSFTADEVKNLLNPDTGQIDPAKIQDLGGPDAQVNPISSSIKTTQMSANNPQGNLIPDTSVPPPNEQIPLGEISPDQLQSGNALQTVPGQAAESATSPMFTQIDAKQQVVPQEPTNGELPIKEAQNLKRTLGNMAYDDPSTPNEVKGALIAANQNIDDIIAKAFQPSDKNSVNPYSNSNLMLTTVHDLAKEVGVPRTVYSTGEKISPTGLESLVNGVKSSLLGTDQPKFQRIVGLLSKLDPEGAQAFQNNVQNLSDKISALKSAGSNPLDQQAALSEQGLNTPSTDQAAQNIQQVNTIKNVVGAPSGNVDLQGNPTPDAQIYKFLDNLSSDQPATKADVQNALTLLNQSDFDPAIVKQLADSPFSEQQAQLKYLKDNIGTSSDTEAGGKISQFLNKLSDKDPQVQKGVSDAIDYIRNTNPELAAQLETSGKDLSRQSELQDTQGISGKSIWSRPYYALKGAVGTVVNRVGTLADSNSSPIVSPFFKALPVLINSPYLQQYAPVLSAAYARGTTALTATNYSLMQSDPEYRALQNNFNSRFN